MMFTMCVPFQFHKRHEYGYLGLGRSPGEGNGNSLQYSYMENLMDRGAWWATVHGVTKGSDKTERLSTHKAIILKVPWAWVWKTLCAVMLINTFNQLITGSEGLRPPASCLTSPNPAPVHHARCCQALWLLPWDRSWIFWLSCFILLGSLRNLCILRGDL